MFIVKAELIERFIKENNLTVKEFAKKCNVPLVAITRVLKYKRSYNFILIFRIACGLDIDVRKLFEEMSILEDSNLDG